MSKKSEQSLQNLCKWYLEHKGECSDLEKRVELLETAIVNLIYSYSYFVEDLQKVEQGQTNVILPKGLLLNDKLRSGTGG